MTTKQIIIKLTEWIGEDAAEEAFRILLQLELEKDKSPEGLLEELEKFERIVDTRDISKFLKDRR